MVSLKNIRNNTKPNKNMNLSGIIAMLLSISLALSLCGCGSKTSEPAETVTEAENFGEEPAEDLQDTAEETKDKAEVSENTAETATDTAEVSEDVAESATDKAENTEDVAENVDNAGTNYTLSDGISIPELTINDLDVPKGSAFDRVYSMGVGFNLGNTFDAYNDGGFSDEMAIEEYWQHTYTTQEMIKDIHELGFDTIRIPVSWHNHVDDDLNISAQWLDRVNEVVDWALDEGMYVIINIHHDNHQEAGGFYPDSAHMDQSKRYITRIWEQLSARFINYDYHLIFESMNEPRLVGHENEWWINKANKDCQDSIECINELNQIFVDTVRASGGNNTSRYLMCPGYCASVDGAINPGFKLPIDPEEPEVSYADGHILVSIHAYTPYSFALEYPGVDNFDQTSTNSTRDLDSFMNSLYTTFIKNGIPVVIGEFGCRDKNGNLQDRVNFTSYYVRMARARGMACLWWDNNAFSGDGELFGIYNRKDPDKSNYDMLAALMAYK
ncbi:MAG: cellulase family glycosylhydrolase [Lachnospiraceae bacterium]|nr:cellulase family glycosylhydrolase [Lachnospiraceae bacterium]